MLNPRLATRTGNDVRGKHNKRYRSRGEKRQGGKCTGLVDVGLVFEVVCDE
jgi:hypothetical protein